MIKFYMHLIKDTEQNLSVKVTYIRGARYGNKCVTIYSKEFGRTLDKIFKNRGVCNDSDSRIDRNLKSYVHIYEDDPFYNDILVVLEKRRLSNEAKSNARSLPKIRNQDDIGG